MNTFMHIMGYFKKDLTKQRKAQLCKLFNQYKLNKIPKEIIKKELFNEVIKFDKIYLKDQSYFNPYPNFIL